jgi:hypothetical protein
MISEKEGRMRLEINKYSSEMSLNYQNILGYNPEDNYLDHESLCSFSKNYKIIVTKLRL